MLGRRAVDEAVAAGLLVPLWPRILVDGRRYLDLHTRAAAALLAAGPGSVLTRQTAASLHGCTAADTTTVHVQTRYVRWSRCRPGLRVHNGPFPDDAIDEIDGLATFTLDHVVAGLLCDESRADALACADQAVALRPASRWDRFIAAVDSRIQRRADRRGTKRGLALLGLVDGRAESPAESWLRLLVIDAGFPIPQAQFQVRNLRGEPVYRLDLAWPELRIALEYDGYEAHADRAAADLARDTDLAGRGWITVRATASDLASPRQLLDALAEAFGARRALALRVRRVAG